MNDIVRQKLQYIIMQYGRSICDEPKRCEALLRDFCPEYKREVNVLVSALKERVAAELMTASDALPKEFLIERLTKRLYDNLGMAEEFARWAVESWAIALVTPVPKTPDATPKPSVTPQSKTKNIFNRLISNISHLSEPQTGSRCTEPQTGAKFVYISPSEFMMGSPENEPGRDPNETLHRVKLTRGFYMQTTQVTQDQWKKLMGNNPSYFKGAALPVENVSWEDAVEFCEKLSLKTGKIYRLPTEAEWEYACRAGTDTPFSFGRCLSTDQANYDGNYPLKGCPKGEYREKTVPAASFLSNAWGLYDMHGNVWEWCQDWYGNYSSSAVTDPTGPSSGSYRVLRGGSWLSLARLCRSANRDWESPVNQRSSLGFRLVLSPDQFTSVPKAKTPATPTKPPVTPPQITVPAPFTSAPKVKKVVAPPKPLVTQPQAGDRYSEPLTGAEFVYIPPGEFMMGSPEDEPGRSDDETLHRVRLTRGFYMQTTQVTQDQWKRIMGDNPSKFKGADLPVERVSWNDAVEFCEKLSRKTGKIYRLPTEAEWEYACRAGTDTAYYFGNDSKRLKEYAWFASIVFDKTHPVAQLKSNVWGLYDMHGNVWEWCHDWYGDYPSSAVTDPTGPSSGLTRVRRGGSWLPYARCCRSANRLSYSPDFRHDFLSFRIVLPVDQQG